MDCLGPFGKAAEGAINVVWKHGVRHVTYIINYKQNVLELNDSAKDLGFEKERINHQRDEAEKNLNNIEGKVTEWVRKVGEIETVIDEFENDDGHKRARSPNCYVFPYLWNRHKLGRKAKKMEVDVKKLIDESPEFDEVSYRQNITSNDATLYNYGFVEFGSTKSTMEKVMRQLEDSSVRMIGLYGPGGVGKSTLVKEIARKAKDEKLFDVVVKVEITVNPNVQKIQEEIAYVLGLRLEGEGENVRADCLRRRLKIKKGSTLLILDDLWDKLDLSKLGVPLDDDDDDDLSNDKVLEKDDNNKDPNRKVLKKEKILGGVKGCKILLTSRDKKVLCDEMDVKSTFCVKELDDKDALMLFQKLVGIHNEISDSKQEIVKKYCAGLPMAIVTVARALKSKSESVWEATLEKLKKQELVGVQISMDISVKMSYDHLENEEIKSIFLLCAQMGHQPLVMDLVRYCFGLGLLEGVSSLWEARDRIKTSIQKLKDSGLLLDGSSNNHFNMHDMVRDAALSIASKDRNVFTLRNAKLDDWPEFESCTSISICNCDIIDGLPEVINSPQLKFFQIETKDTSLIIPENFFEGMKDLKVLILTGFRLSRLPSSIKCLLKLRMLCLERCYVDDNLSVGELKKLRILSFSGSQLQNFPIELGCLDKLQLLDISDCSIETNIPLNLLSSLKHLEELYIRKSLIKMLAEGETSQYQKLFFSELKNLCELKVVDLSIPCATVLPTHLFFDKLKDYKIVIGDLEMFGDFIMPDKYETFRVLALQLHDNTDIHSQEDIKSLFKTVQSLLLGKVNGVQNVVSDLNIDGFPDLKHLSIINNNHIKCVSSSKFFNSADVFPNLESLCLYGLGNLEMISYGPITVASFAKLKAINVKMCYQLKNLYSVYNFKFSTSGKICEISECNFMDQFRASVEIIEVCECGSLKEILQIPMDYGKVEFLKLHTLTLQSLPSFTSFYTEVKTSCSPHPAEPQTTSYGNREITSEDEQSVKTPTVFGELVEIPNLESLNLSALNIHKIWSDQPSSSFCFQNLIKLVVKECDKLTYLCSLSVAHSLKKLKSLVIIECAIMEKIIETKGNILEKVCVFPKLEEIHLSKMNALTDVWQTNVSVDSFSSLISVTIEECNKLDKIFPSHMEGWFESLENLRVSRCESVEVTFEINDSQEIDASGGIDTNLQVILLDDLPKLKQLWSIDPDGILNFKKLRTIEVYSCGELRNLFPASIANDVPKLERMSALYCENMVEIIASEDASEDDKDPLVFPELTYMRLYWLRNIKHFYKGRRPIKCPKLKEFSIDNYVNIFIKETSKTNEEENFVFSAQEVFSNLECMEIDFYQAQKLLPKFQMHRLKELSLISVKSVNLLHQFPYAMPNLQKLKLFSSYGEDLVASANSVPQNGLGIVLELKELVLQFLGIKDLGLGQLPVLRKLEFLSLEHCDKLKNLGPSSVSLTYLTHLELKSCQGLGNLMASSTAKSMVQLKTMKVIDCDGVDQIVSNEGSEEVNEMKIVFPKLISIGLVGLKNMTSFCRSKEFEFEFPSLEILIVRECPKMEKFSERKSITPKLKNVFGVEGDEKTKWQWEGDLNATIQKVFNDKVTYTYTEQLALGRFSYTEFIQQIWHDSHAVHQSSFRSLKRLSAYKVNLLRVIPSHLLSCFENLEELDIRSCSATQFIFNINENRVRKPSGIFRLKSLYLFNLPKLEHVWDKDPKGIIGLKVLKEVRVSRCECLKSLFPASVAKDLTRLEVLEVTECEELAEIFWKDEKGEEGEGTTPQFVFARLTSLTLKQLPGFKYSIRCSKEEEIISNLSERDIEELCLGSRPIPNSCFGLLESLTVDGCQFLSNVLLPFNLLISLTNLETLEVRNSDFVKTIFDVKCTTQNRDVTSVGQTLPFSLKKLTLSMLPNLENVWNEDPHRILSMHHLKQVLVDNCKCLTSLFPASVAKDFVELEHLEVKDCEGLMTIVAEDNTDPSGTKQELPCPPVRSLLLRGLPKFKYFYYSSLQCDNFATENEVYVEKCLSLGEKGLEMILSGEFQRDLLYNLKVLALWFERDVFPHEILEQVPNIEKLVLCGGSFREMFWCESSNNVDYNGLLLQLKVLHLESLGNLISIAACKLTFSNLTYLNVKGCNNLRYLFTSSAAKNLGQLKRMEIKWCESIEEIVSKEVEDSSNEDEIIFPQLNCLNFEDLENLRIFYQGNLSFPSLEEFSVTDCHQLITLSAGTLEVHKLSHVTIDSKEIIFPLKSDLNTIMRKTFLAEISELEQLDLESSPKLRKIWHDLVYIPDLCFSELTTLIVYNCQFLSDAVLPFHLLPSLPKLETLRVQNCYYVKAIFDVKCVQERVNFPLKKMVLWELQNLKNVWNEDPHEILTMHQLQNVYIKKCKGLTSVFPASVAKGIVKLKKLTVKRCKELMTIVADMKGTNVEVTFPCPSVRSLKLRRLPRFKYFYYCSLKSDVYTHLGSHNEDRVATEKCLSLGEKGMEMILYGEFQKSLLYNLKVLTLYFRSDVFRYEIIEQVPNINKLVVRDGSFKKMFCSQNPNYNVEYSGVLSQLKELRLDSLKELVSIGLDNSWTHPLVRTLETFEVIKCSSLETLVACKVAFSNLTYLNVESCNSLSYLFTSLTAKSLVQLKRMVIKQCESIEEIVLFMEADEADEDKIIFPNLNCLNIEYLTNLRRFYRGSLSFPSLQELSVTECDKMITLCTGTLEADKLSQVTVDISETIPLQTDLHLTMRKKFLRKNGWQQSLEFRDRADLHEIWRVSLQIPYFCFRGLSFLVVDGCQFLSDVLLPFSLLPLLPRLETLEVRNCYSMKTIFDVKCTTQATLITFPPLRKLVLWKLPNLETVWNEDPAEIVTQANPAHPKQTNLKLTFPSVTSLTLWDLPKLKRNSIYCIHDSTPTFELITPNLEHLSVGENELKMIVDGEFQGNHFNKLKILTLYLLTESGVFLEFLQLVPNVENLIVYGGSLKEIFCSQISNNVDPSGLPLQLKGLLFESLGELISIGFENSWTEPFVRNLETFEVISCSSLKNLVASKVFLSNLTYLKIARCDNLSYLFTSSTAKSLRELKEMVIKRCKSIEEIVSKEGEEWCEDKEIVFKKLQVLYLKNLDELRCFYPGNFTLSFPSLERVHVINCSSMKTFSAFNEIDHSTEWYNAKYAIPLEETDLNSAVRRTHEEEVIPPEEGDLNTSVQRTLEEEGLYHWSASSPSSYSDGYKDGDSVYDSIP